MDLQNWTGPRPSEDSLHFGPDEANLEQVRVFCEDTWSGAPCLEWNQARSGSLALMFHETTMKWYRKDIQSVYKGDEMIGRMYTHFISGPENKVAGVFLQPFFKKANWQDGSSRAAMLKMLQVAKEKGAKVANAGCDETESERVSFFEDLGFKSQFGFMTLYRGL